MLSTHTIEEQLRNYRLEPMKVYVEECEHRMSLPYFMTAFNSFINVSKRIPSQNEFVAYYFMLNKAFFAKQNYTNEQKQGIIARIIRSYPSLIRETHFTALLAESGMKVVYDESMDVDKGIDQVVEFMGERFFIHCFVQTPGSRRHRRMKDKRHNFGKNNIDLVFDLHSPDVRQIGPFKLYSERHIEYLKNAMRSELI